MPIDPYSPKGENKGVMNAPSKSYISCPLTAALQSIRVNPIENRINLQFFKRPILHEKIVRQVHDFLSFPYIHYKLSQNQNKQFTSIQWRKRKKKLSLLGPWFICNLVDISLHILANVGFSLDAVFQVYKGLFFVEILNYVCV